MNLPKQQAAAGRWTTEVQEIVGKQLQTRWKEVEAQLRDMLESNSAHVQQFAASLQQSESEHQQLHIAIEGRLQLDARHGTTNLKRGTPDRKRGFRDWGTTRMHSQGRDSCPTYWTSEHEATLSSRMLSVDTGRPIVDAEPEVLLIHRHRGMTQPTSPRTTTRRTWFTSRDPWLVACSEAMKPVRWNLMVRTSLIMQR